MSIGSADRLQHPTENQAKTDDWIVDDARRCRGLLFGMLAGIAMGIEQDFAPAPAQAHLDLVSTWSAACCRRNKPPQDSALASARASALAVTF